jgi:hypothetical protein
LGKSVLIYNPGMHLTFLSLEEIADEGRWGLTVFLIFCTKSHTLLRWWCAVRGVDEN